MTPLDIISLEQAKAELVMTGIDDRDAEITRLIETAIAWVEKYTSYYLYQRNLSFTAYGYETFLPFYPITVTGVTYEGEPYTKYKEKLYPLELRVTAPPQSTIEATVGFANVSDIPPPLIEAAYKLIVYLFNNKDIYMATLPMDVQVLLNQFRRSPTF